MRVVPAINCENRECVESALAKIRSFLSAGEWIHLDVSDGQFTYRKSWNELALWPHMKVEYNLEVHLMVERPEKLIEPWLYAGAKRLIVHWEAMVNQSNRHRPSDADTLADGLLSACKAYGAEAMLSTNPETPVEPLADYFKQFGRAQALAVHPGLSGQKFLPVVIPKIRFLREMLGSGAMIEVDGGITPETARLVKEAGADTVVAASYLSGEGRDAKEGYEELAGI